MSLEQYIQIASIITFLSSAIAFFVQIGEYKTNLKTHKEEIENIKKNITDINVLENSVTTHEQKIQNLKKEVEEIKAEHNQSITEVKTLLIEVKTKIDFITPFFNIVSEKNGRKK